MFTEEQINEILAVCEKSPLGPWKYEREEQSTGAESGLKLVFETVVDANGVKILRSHDKWLAQFIAISRTALPQLAEEVIKLRAVAEVAKHFYGICFDMPIDFPSAGPFVWGMGDLKDALAAAGYGGEE